ncbi:MAG: phosphoserine phosphatase RsbU/P [Clostridia bacterium]|jgi:sigma-B regulation protein RsbU (phosphoserine phosphatase)|nr:phosphoserine phosphatase RsbU/P [Clostridiales bacterium]MDK2934256.1 phosphoserine phosphatase RsbU/P [Clostridiales bacterium]MDN5323030.1 phosphoserine phosphatase RsbU/P [Clostridia bacterium]
MGRRERIIDFFNKYKYYFLFAGNFLFSFILFHFAYLFEDSFARITSIVTFLTWHNIFEFTSIIISFSIFVVTYYTYDQNNNLRSLFLGNTFFTIGLIDFFHTLSYKGMAEFIIPNTDPNRATTFWIISGLIGGTGYLITSFIDKKCLIIFDEQVKIKNRNKLFTFWV